MISPIYPQDTKPEVNSPELLSKLNPNTGSISVGTTRLTFCFSKLFRLLFNIFLYPLTIPQTPGAPLPVKVTLILVSGYGDIPGMKDGVKNRPDARGRSAAANPIRQPGALGTIFVFPFIPGWGFSSFFPLLLWGPHILPGVPLPDRVTPLEAQRGRMVPFILRRSEERAGCPRPACGLTGGDVGDPSSSHGGGWGRGIFF